MRSECDDAVSQTFVHILRLSPWIELFGSVNVVCEFLLFLFFLQWVLILRILTSFSSNFFFHYYYYTSSIPLNSFVILYSAFSFLLQTIIHRWLCYWLLFFYESFCPFQMLNTAFLLSYHKFSGILSFDMLRVIHRVLRYSE